MSGGAMVSWAIAVVSEFDSAGRRIPECGATSAHGGCRPLGKEQPQPVRVDALQKRFGLSRATAYRWQLALQDLNDPVAAKRRLPACGS